MDKLLRFKKSIQHIEDHLHGEISLEQAAQAGFTSLMQLYRDFYAYTGHSVKEYIRKRRLSNALSLIRCSDMPLAEIAYTSGYSSQQALCKCVKSAISMTPLEYKRSEISYYFPRFDSIGARQVTVAAETIPPTVRTAFYHPRLSGIEELAIAALRAELPDYRGRLFGRNGRQQGNRFCYELWLENVPAAAESLLRSKVFREVEIHPELSLTAAKTIVRNEEQEIGQAWNYLYTDWLKSSMFEQDRQPYFEEFLSRNNRVNRLALFVPVTKRTDYDRISLIRSPRMVFLAATREGPYGEKEAARAVMDFLAVYRPSAIRSATTFYVAHSSGNCTCGVKLAEPLLLPAGSGLELLELPAGDYAVIETGCTGDGRVLEARLHAWVRDNGLRRSRRSAFALHEANGGFAAEHIATTCWIQLEPVKNG
ncbi:helix-turn-helix domain-containing protein [Paenibacillus sp. YN15]|uniref:helix-turn-helix domain-containing protein n=1 Tax=Paenibacillus sp. YN15 TaxID=1742774 RepID=UPI000DCE7B17|nr:helix-turn-helix domain-containing protein [Paenibacillus sp. YN15]RAU92587.1 hypothetical protein DQG13_27235 [Paenibacillus sp. YN15]